MRFATFYRDVSAALLLAAFLLLCSPALAQDSGSDPTVLRTDRPSLSVTARDGAGAEINTAGTVKLYRDGMLADETGLSRGRAFFASLQFGSYTLVVEANGYKPAQRDVNASVAMRYEIDANLQREGISNTAEGPAKPMLAPKAKEALDKGLKALSKNKLSEAEKYVSEAASLAPGHPDVLYLQGVLFLKQQNWVQAESALEKASQMDPTNGRAFSALGMAFVDQGNYDAAIPPLEKSVQLNSGTWETEWALGKAYYQRQQYDQALKASQQAWRDSKGQAPEIELLLAKSLTAVGNYEDSAQALRDFLKRYGDSPEAPTARRYLNRLASDGKIHSN